MVLNTGTQYNIRQPMITMELKRGLDALICLEGGVMKHHGM